MRPLPNADPWLERHIDALRLAGRRVLEVGCGPGTDAAFLAANGFEVVAFDRANPGRAALGTGPAWVLADATALPFRARSFDAAVASLSLHYLPWAETARVFREVGDLLEQGGALLFRVNASDDVNHGAGQGEEVEPGFFRVPGEAGFWSETKRFFSEQAVRAVLPAGFEIEVLEHRTITRFREPKQVWECRARRLT